MNDVMSPAGIFESSLFFAVDDHAQRRPDCFRRPFIVSAAVGELADAEIPPAVSFTYEKPHGSGYQRIDCELELTGARRDDDGEWRLFYTVVVNHPLEESKPE